MSERVLLVIEQPCVLCEGTLETWTLWRDDEQDTERIDKDHDEHQCRKMDELITERGQGSTRAR